MGVITDTLNATVDLQRRTSISDGRGGQTSAWSTVGTYPARLSQPSGADAVTGDQTQAQITGHVYFDDDCPVVRGDRIIDGDRTLEVVVVLVPSEPIYRRADCVDVQAGT